MLLGSLRYYPMAQITQGDLAICIARRVRHKDQRGGHPQ
jgi:hypothetical protein